MQETISDFEHQFCKNDERVNPNGLDEQIFMSNLIFMSKVNF